MEKFLRCTTSRQVSDVQEIDDFNMDLGSDNLSRSTSLVSVDSAESVDSASNEKYSHIKTFFNFDETHATCVKCGTKLKVSLSVKCKAPTYLSAAPVQSSLCNFYLLVALIIYIPPAYWGFVCFEVFV